MKYTNVVLSLISLLNLNNTLAVKFKLLRDKFNDKSETVLHKAAALNHWVVVKSLAQRPCSINFLNKTNIDTNTAIHTAAYNDNSYIIELLLKAKADPNIKNNKNYTALDLALLNKNYSSAEVLVIGNGEINNIKETYLKTLDILSIINKNYLNLAKFLLLKLNKNNLITELTKDNKSNFAHIIAFFDLQPNFNFFSNKEVNQEALDQNLTPLFIACQNGNVNSANYLLKCKANINKTNANGWTPLHIASYNNHTEIVKLLLRHKADYSLISNNNETALDLVKDQNNLEVCKIINCYIKRHKELIEIKNSIVNENLLKARNIINNSDFISKNTKKILCHESCNILHLMAFFNITKNLENHKNIESVLKINKLTPLFIACKRRNIEFVKKILQLGASPNKCVKDLWTPLHVAAKHERIDIVKLLIEYNAIIMLEQKDGLNALDFARETGNGNLVEFLSKKLFETS